ncbi:MAG: tetratricopeptide repeat protein [Acidimicrobiales bacterium]|nr:tetratricopeptide repeat protein [Acidimicrobiales bacterium]
MPRDKLRGKPKAPLREGTHASDRYVPAGPRPEPDAWVRTDAAEARPASSTDRREQKASIDRARVRAELLDAVGPARADRLTDRIAGAATAFANDRLDDARRTLGPIAKEAPGSPTVRELLGLTFYRLGRWSTAIRELEALRELTGGVDQHPVLADSYRALGRHAEAGALWEELREASPDADLVAEGRIVAAGSLADQGRLADAIRLLERAPRARKVRDHHLRTAYALADLRERAGDVARSRELFAWIEGIDPDFGDVGRRVAALS